MGSGGVGGCRAMAALGWRAAGRRISHLHHSISSPFPLFPTPLESPPLLHTLLPPWQSLQTRGKSRGNEYQPNNWKRKKTHGWIRRISSPGGIAVILRRMLKGRKSLSH